MKKHIREMVEYALNREPTPKDRARREHGVAAMRRLNVTYLRNQEKRQQDAARAN